MLLSAGAAAPPSTELAAVRVSSWLERLAPADGGGDGTSPTPVPGEGASHADQLIYSVRFENRSVEAVDGVRITSPIPVDLRYVPASASGPASQVLFSVDAGRSFGQPAELSVVDAAGGRRPADAADYTHVRWILAGALDAGAAGVVRFRAVPR